MIVLTSIEEYERMIVIEMSTTVEEESAIMSEELEQSKRKLNRIVPADEASHITPKRAMVNFKFYGHK